MRKVALFAACLIAYAVLIVFLVPARASALSPAGLPKGVFQDDSVQQVRRGFRGGGFRGHAFRGGGFRGHAFRGVRGPAFRGHAFRGGGFRGHAFRGVRGPAFRGHAFRGRGFRGPAFRAHAFRGPAFRGRAFRGHAFRGGRAWRGRHYGWRGRGWRRPGWGWGAAALATAPFFYGGYYGRCPLVRQTVWTPRGYRLRWVRRCW
jgi:hypothetical protein